MYKYKRHNALEKKNAYFEIVLESKSKDCFFIVQCNTNHQHHI